jgi:hypothetical protein
MNHFEYLSQPNVFYGILAATVVYMLIGMIWYSPKVFGEMWMKLSGVKTKNVDMAKAYVGCLISALLVVTVTSCLLHRLLINGYEASVLVAIKLWLGFIAPTLLGGVLWEGRPVKLFALNAAAHLLQLVAAAAVLSYF